MIDRIRDWIDTVRFMVLIVPPLMKTVMGRWHVFRESSDWLIVEVCSLDEADTDDETIKGMLIAARAERDLRARR